MKPLFGNGGDKEGTECTTDESKLVLREEELDIKKDRVPAGEVLLKKEIIEEQKVIDVPVMHEEVVIERHAVDCQPSDTPIGDEEEIRIPVTQEKVDVDKHTIVTGEVSAYKREIDETEQIEETLKREEAKVEAVGNPDIDADETIHFH